MSFKFLFTNNYSKAILQQGISQDLSRGINGAPVYGLVMPNIEAMEEQAKETSSDVAQELGFDANAGRQELYNSQRNAYLKEYFSKKGFGNRRYRKAMEYFDNQFEKDWKASEQTRRNEYMAQQREPLLAQKIEQNDAKVRQLEQTHDYDAETNSWKKKLVSRLKTAGLNFGSVRDVQTWLTNKGFDTKGIDNMYGANTKAAIDKLLNDPTSGLTDEEKQKFRDFQNSATFYRAKKVKTPPVVPTQKSNYNQIHSVIKQKFGDEVGNLYIDPITGQPVSRIPYNPTSAQTSSTATQTSSVPSNQDTYAQPEISNSNLVGAESYRNEHTMRHAFNEIFNNQVNGKYTLNGNLIDDVAIQRDPNYQKSWENFKAQYKDNGSGFMKGFFSWILDDRYTKRNKNGGTINKYKQGNKMNNEQELQKAFMAYLIEDAAAKGVQIQSEQDLQAYAQQLGEEGLKVKYQEFMQKMQGQSVKAALGAKLNYIRKIKGMCPDGEETYFFKEGGSIKSGCKPCMAKAQKGQELKTKGNAIQDFKNKRKHINESDTVHTKYGIRDLNGNTKYPKWNPKKENYTTQERQRVVEKDWDSGKKIKVDACGGKAKKKK